MRRRLSSEAADRISETILVQNANPGEQLPATEIGPQPNQFAFVRSDKSFLVLFLKKAHFFLTYPKLR